jgi:hypothetical protein
MTAVPTTSDAVQRAPHGSVSGDDGPRAAVLNLLRSSGYAALRGLRCEVTEAVVVVRGVVPSYYLKQVAQAAVLRLDGIRGVRNLVEVREAGPGR